MPKYQPVTTIGKIDKETAIAPVKPWRAKNARI
jgi:hypothetical protein